MRTRGAVVREAPGSYEVVDLEVEEPRQGELLVKMAASGMCHSDDHFATGDMVPGVYPWLGGHEGSGVVEQVGPNTVGFERGDHVIFSFLPGCGKCRWCASGMQNLCDYGSSLLTGSRFDDVGSYRVRTLDGQPVGQMCGLGTFSEHITVSTLSAVKIDKDVPLEKVCLLGCCVGTGWGSAVNSADVRPGDTVIVMGIGGVGINAVQGAAHAGADHVIAVDPVGFKRETAEQLGATRSFDNIDEATEYAKGLTNGQGADSAIITVGITTGEHIAQGFSAIRKGGTVVVTGIGDMKQVGIPISPTELTTYQKRLQGTHFGACRPSGDIPRQVNMYRSGSLKLDELITKTYSLDQVADGYRDMHAGTIIRGVITFDR
jgi:NDMA-dependent alcohol dehydrogenase